MVLVPALSRTRVGTTDHCNMPPKSGDDTAHTRPSHPQKGVSFLLTCDSGLSVKLELCILLYEKGNCTHQRRANINQENALKSTQKIMFVQTVGFGKNVLRLAVGTLRRQLAGCRLQRRAIVCVSTLEVITLLLLTPLDRCKYIFIYLFIYLQSCCVPNVLSAAWCRN